VIKAKRSVKTNILKYTFNVWVVESACDLVQIRCQSWSTRSRRLTTNNTINTTPSLTYTVLQVTDGAYVKEEPITQRGKHCHIVI
jgi:hypothetical protein